MLLHFLRWLGKHSDLDFSLVLMREGELLSEFAESAPLTSVHNPPGLGRAARSMHRIGWADEGFEPSPNEMGFLERAVRATARAVVVRELRHRTIGSAPVDLVFLNTIACGPILPVFPPSVPVVTYVHELSFQLWLARQYAPTGFREVLTRTRKFLAASNRVALTLQAEYGITPERIDVCHEFIPVTDAPPDPVRVRSIRDELKATPTTRLVGSVGTVDWRKGTDLFIQLAKRVISMQPDHDDTLFVWVGAPEEFWWEKAVHHDLVSLGIADRVRFTGPLDDPAPFLEAMDVFVLTSRADAFPVAALEAAAHRKPLVCFDAGGITEFLEPDDRLVMPYLDLDAMAKRTVELLAADDERHSLGERVAQRVWERHRVEVGAPVLLSYIERELRRARDDGSRVHS